MVRTPVRDLEVLHVQIDGQDFTIPARHVLEPDMIAGKAGNAAEESEQARGAKKHARETLAAFSKATEGIESGTKFNVVGAGDY